jgi:hypothetical protein
MPHDAPSLEGALLAAQAGLIVLVLIGDPACMQTLSRTGQSLAA